MSDQLQELSIRKTQVVKEQALSVLTVKREKRH